ncbi:RF-1 domain-containing protein [Lipomyces tetrasporus]|uniref:RF-1 domain-containing protein n=1 Tax=Lipomyces tetrasporus TaxID=54092 RepID=A0AAD7QTB0_9ASCO|nr:RF-1 domain-containing protein [Lipomyces tetrasporus]KAJ8101119.1 RF-1 domain-containing protein [Lipomyces tetrasporus]
MISKIVRHVVYFFKAESLFFALASRRSTLHHGGSYSGSTDIVRDHMATFCSAMPRCKNIALPPRPAIPEDEIEEVFIKGGGKGGQKINKTNSKVQLRHIPTGLVVSSQATRSREQNRKLARRELAEELEYLRDPENSRRGQKIKQLRQKKTRQRKKAVRRERKRQDSLNGELNEPFDELYSEVLQEDTLVKHEHIAAGARSAGSHSAVAGSAGLEDFEKLVELEENYDQKPRKSNK